MRLGSALALAVSGALSVASAASGAEVRMRGKIEVAANVPLVAVSTDPIVQRVLNDDFYAAGRHADANAKVATTLTVTLTQQLLKPGVSLAEVAPGDPGILALLRAAGAATPPVGDAGTRRVDPYEALVRMEALRPEDPALRRFKEQQAFNRSIGMPGSGGPLGALNAADEQSYDTAIVARVTIGDRRDQFTVVAVAHPGDDPRELKKLMAEEIANAALR